MAKNARYESDQLEPRDKTRIRGGWKDERRQARHAKAMRRHFETHANDLTDTKGQNDAY